MDRRQLKTRKAIFNAFQTLLKKKRYERITVGEIIEAADVGRSTFYAHFETKEALLEAMCAEIFHHVFENDPCSWSGGSDNELEAKLSHTLWHVRDSQNDLAGILVSDSGEVFMTYFKRHLGDMFKRYTEESNDGVPQDLRIYILSSAFADTVRRWVSLGFKESPEVLAGYFMSVMRLK